MEPKQQKKKRLNIFLKNILLEDTTLCVKFNHIIHLKVDITSVILGSNMFASNLQFKSNNYFDCKGTHKKSVKLTFNLMLKTMLHKANDTLQEKE